MRAASLAQEFREHLRSQVEKGERVLLRWALESEFKKGEGDFDTVTISTGQVDRYNTVLNPEGWDLKGYRKNPVVLWAHMRSELPIGRSIKEYVEGSKLKSDIEWVPSDMNPWAGVVRRMYDEKYLRGWSVGFVPQKIVFPENAEEPALFEKNELVEFSAVPVPANPGALSDGMAPEEYAAQASAMVRALTPFATAWVQTGAGTWRPVPVGAIEGTGDYFWVETDDSFQYRYRDTEKFFRVRTIDFSKKEGIKAIVGPMKLDPDGPKVKVQMLLFAKSNDWTLVRAKEWVAENKDDLKAIFKSVPSSMLEKEWDGFAAQYRVMAWAKGDAEKKAKAHALVVGQDRLLIHHDVEGGALVTIKRGVEQAMVDLEAHKGLLIPNEYAAAKAHLDAHVAEFNRAAIGDDGKTADEVIEERKGAVLRQSNLERLTQAVELIELVIDTAKKPDDDDDGDDDEDDDDEEGLEEKKEKVAPEPVAPVIPPEDDGIEAVDIERDEEEVELDGVEVTVE